MWWVDLWVLVVGLMATYVYLAVLGARIGPPRARAGHRMLNWLDTRAYAVGLVGDRVFARVRRSGTAT